MPRISSCRSILLLAVFVVLCCSAYCADYFVYFGAHGQGPGIGFSLAHFNSDTGKLTTPVFLQEAAAPAYFTFTQDGKHLYTCNSYPASDVSAYAVDTATGKLTFLNKKPSMGGDPSYVSLDATGRYVMVANYLGGSIIVYAVSADGSLGERTAFVQHTGDSATPDNQTKPHAHSIRSDATNRFVLVADLGLDKVFVYRLNAATGALTPNDPPSASVAPGQGPRHFAFDPKEKFLYEINQMGTTIQRFGWNAEDGVLTPFESISTLPVDFKGTSDSAELLMHPSGKFMFATNRGHNSVAVFSVQADTGKLALLQHISTQGKTPRNCEIDPTGKWLLVTNQDSNNAVIYRIDQKTGRLTQNGDPVQVPAPFGERFLAVGK